MHEGRRRSWWSALGGAFVALALALPTLSHALTQDVTGQFAITRTGLLLNRTTNTFDSSVTLRNSADVPVLAPIDVVVGGLPAGVTLANKTGDQADGRPFVRPMAAGAMLQSGGTLTFVLKFANPARVSFSSTLQVLQTVETPPGAPTLISAVTTGQTTAFLTGRIDGAPNRDVVLQAFSSRTCVLGLLVSGVPAGGPVTARTDRDGYFGVPVAGVGSGDFVTLQLTSPAPTGPSPCLVASRDNDSWPKAFLLDGSTSTARDFIDAPGKARWYKFAVVPGQRIDITLSGLPADYDLAAFKDIGEAFASQFNPATAGPSDLLKLTAEFAPSTFSPSTFSPSTFSPSTFSPDAYSPSTFSPSTFSPSVFSPSTFSPSTFSPSTFSPSTFSPSTFSPSTFSPSKFGPFSPSIYTLTEVQQAFSTAQTRSIVAISATAGLSDESTVVNTWNRTGHFYVRVTGRGAAFDTSRPFTLTVTKGVTSCAAVTDTALTTRPAVAASGLKTVLLTDSAKVALDAPLDGPAGGTLRSKLVAFAARPEISGVLVDVAGDARVAALEQQAASHPACPYAKNLVAEEIKGIVDSYRSNPLQYVVIVGNDDAIPFFRSPDQSVIGQESGYVPPVSSNSPSEASLRRDFVLSQDKYGSKTSITLPWNEFPVPGLAVGRVVETASEIAGLIDAYVAADSVVSPRSSLVTGYDFLEDAANAVKSELDAGTGTAGDALITPSGTSPQAPASWKAEQLAAKLFGSRHDVIFLAGHFSANSALAADFATSLLTTDLLASSTDFTNSIVFSAGCHAGYNLVDGDSIPGVTLPLDWAQAFARKRATLIAGTGYQYGDTDFLEYSERLYSNLARQLRAGSAGTRVAVGEALVQAKLAYLAATPDIRGLHEKALLEATLFGLPMLAVDMPAGRGAIPGTSGAVNPTPVAAGPAASLGLRTFDLDVAPALTPHTQSLVNLPGGPGITARWLSGPDGVVAKPGEPALPLAVVNVTPTDPGLVLRGIGYRGGSYADTGPMIPLTGAATTESRGVHVPFLSPVFYPTTMWTPNYFGALAGNGGTQLLVSPVQHRAARVADGTSTERRHSGMMLRLYYSGNVSQAALSDAPAIVAVDAQRDAAGAVAFTANVVGDPAAAIHGVWITFTGDGTNAWVSLDLEQCVAPLPAACGGSEDSRVWKGRLAAPPANIKYFVQAANGVGLVSRNDNFGANFGIGSLLPTATRLELATPPSSATVGDSPTVTARLTYAGGTALAGQLVAIGVGGASRFGVTGSDGNVTVRMPVTATPGSYLITAAFTGDDVYQPSSASAPLTINRAPVVPSVLPPAPGTAGINVAGNLGGTSAGLQQVPVAFTVIGPAGTTTVFSITDYLGNAIFPPPSGLPPGNYTVIQASFGGDGTFVSTTITFPNPLQVSVPKLNQSIWFDRAGNGLDHKTFGDPDFALFASASSGLAVSFAAGGACTVTGNTVHLTGIGSCTIDADQAGDATYNAAPRATQTFTIGTPAAAPTVLSLVRAAQSPTMSDTADYTLTFSEPVTGVAASNFAVVASGITAASVFGIGGAGATWTVTVNTGRGTGTLHLDLVNGTGIVNAANTPLAGAPVTGETYQIDKGGTVIGTGHGRPVPGFGIAGYALFGDVPRVAAPSAIAVLADGRILAAGGIGCAASVPSDPDSPVYCTLQLARYLASGAPDTSFGTGGRLSTAITGINPELSGLFVHGDGSFTVAGSLDNGTAEVPFAARFTSAGAPIDTFGTSGVATLNSLPLGLGITGADVDGSGRVVVVGTTPDVGPERNDIFVARLTTRGLLDPTFGNGGVARFALSVVDERSDRGTAVAIQPDGKIVVGGRTQVTAGLGFDFVVLRLNANGGFDSTFVNGGVATTRFSGTSGENLGRKLVVQPDGKIVLIGGVTVGSGIQCGIARFNSDGSPDAGFGVDGRVLEPLTAGCFHVSRQADGKLVVVGNDQVDDVQYGTFLRLDSAGAPDAAFGTGGIVDISNFVTPARVVFTANGNLVTSLVIQDSADGLPKSYVVELTGGLAPNQPPVANAGPDQTVVAGATVQLSSAGSFDPEGNPLGFAWTMTSKPAGSAAAFDNSTFANPAFVADRKGTYVAQLIVNDGGTPPLDSAADSVEITATNRAPVAQGDSYSVAMGATLTISAATGLLANDSDADGDALTAVLVANVTHGSLSLNADGGFTYTPTAGYSGPDGFTYRASDGIVDGNAATVSLTVTPGVPVNHPPVANAGGSLGAIVGSPLQLGFVGSCTDVDGDATTRTWSLVARPQGSNAQLVVDAMPGSPSFTPDVAGPYQLQLVCNDGHVDSAPSVLALSVSEAPQNAITVSSLALAPGQSQAFFVALTTPAPAGGLTVNLASSDTNVVTVPASVFIAAGGTAPAVNPIATAVAPGTATITATASGYETGTGSVVVAALTVLTVTNTNDSGAGSLRDAVAQANSNPDSNLIVFGVAGTIGLTSGELRITNPLTIVGPGAANLTIDGNLNGSIFTIAENSVPDCPALTGPSDFQVSISGMTLTRGSSNVADEDGGAIRTAKTLVLSDVIVRDSQARGGGAVAFYAQYAGQALSITNSQFINNVAKPVVAGDTNSHNGGALLAYDFCAGTRVPALVIIDRSVFSGNRVQPVTLEGRGGAIAVGDNSTLHITDTRIVDNHVEPPVPRVAGFRYPGGAIQTVTTAVTIFRSEIAGNSADFGGGLSIAADIPGFQDPGSAWSFLLIDSTVSGNTAAQSGGGVILYGNVNATITNSTVAANTAPAASTAGLQVASGPTNPPSASNATPPALTLVSSIVANGASNASDIGGLPSPAIPSPYTLGIDNSLLGVAPSANFVLTGGGSRIGEDPKLLALADNGGPTRTHALQADSPAIDTGSNPFGLITDQRGEGFARVLGASADMGAYERVPSGSPGAPVVTTTTPGSIRRNQRTPIQITGTGLAGASVTSADPALQVSGVSASSLQVNFNVDVPSAAALGSRNFNIANAGGQATVTLQVTPALTLTVVPATIALLPDSVNHNYTLQVSEASSFAQTFTLATVDPAVLRVVTTVVTIPANALQGTFTLAGLTTGTTQLLVTPAGGQEASEFQVLVGAEAGAANFVYAPIVGVARGDPSQAPGGTQTQLSAPPVGLARGDPSQAPGGTTTQVSAPPVGLARGDPSQAPGGTTTQVSAPPVGLARGDPSQAPGGTTTQVSATPVGMLKGDVLSLPPGQIVGPLIARPVGLNRL